MQLTQNLFYFHLVLLSYHKSLHFYKLRSAPIKCNLWWKVVSLLFHAVFFGLNNYRSFMALFLIHIWLNIILLISSICLTLAFVMRLQKVQQIFENFSFVKLLLVFQNISEIFVVYQKERKLSTKFEAYKL